MANNFNEDEISSIAGALEACDINKDNSSSSSFIPTTYELVKRSEELLMWYQQKYLTDPSLKDSTPSKAHPHIKKVQDMKLKDVLARIKKCWQEIKEAGLKLVNQSPSNTRFVGERVDASRFALIHGNKLYTPRADTEQVFLRVLEFLERNCKNQEYRTLRSLFYMDVGLFRIQARSDAAVDQVACKLGCTRSSLNIFASDTGTVIGPMSFLLESKLTVNCNFEHIGKNSLKYKYGVCIPPLLQVAELKNNDANFVLIVEKYSTFIDLAQHNFHVNYKCIIITGDGMPYATTRKFVKRVMDEFKIPMFILTDCDPWGLEIATIYRYGSGNLAYDSKNLASPLIYWLGAWPTDLTSDIPYQELTKEDINKIEQLLEKDWIKKSVIYTSQLKYMLDTGRKTELESLSVNDTSYLSTKFLPRKLYEAMCLIMEGKFERNHAVKC